MAKITGVGHAGFTDMNMDRTLKFYVDKLGGERLLSRRCADMEIGVYDRPGRHLLRAGTAIQ